ncbi:acyltransferase family protein [Marihabitans asiaticum]|uniref:acyltransferase family protein n=1 Tax=Marihabitans asiaticum TaxID=415218 RepID=UPI003CCC5232
MEFLAGAGAAVLMFRWRERRPRHLGPAVLVTALGGYLLATQVWPSWLAVRETALGLTFGALIVAAVTFAPVERVFAWRPVSWLGYRAYSMFLVHQPVAWYVSEFLNKALGVADGPGKLTLLWTDPPVDDRADHGDGLRPAPLPRRGAAVHPVGEGSTSPRSSPSSGRPPARVTRGVGHDRGMLHPWWTCTGSATRPLTASGRGDSGGSSSRSRL